MAFKQVGLRLPEQQLERLDKFAKKRFEGNRSTAVRWLAMQMLDKIESETTFDSDIEAQASSNLAAEVAQLKADVKALQRREMPVIL